MIRKKGFTIIELAIVLAIITLLVATLIPNFVKVRHQAFLNACQQNLKNLSIAIETFASSNNDQYPSGDFIIDSNCLLAQYINKEIKCPLLKEYYEYKIFFFRIQDILPFVQ